MKLINVSALIPVITHRQQNIYLLVHWRLTPTISVFQLEHYDRFFSITKAGMVQWPRSHYNLIYTYLIQNQYLSHLKIKVMTPVVTGNKNIDI